MARGWPAHGLIACPICGLIVQKLDCYQIKGKMSAFDDHLNRSIQHRR